jgi:hypothetical protein
LARQNLGARPTRPNDYVDVEWVVSTYPSFSASATAGHDVVISLPLNPVDHTMFIAEVRATAQIVVSVPNGVLMTTGTLPAVTLYAGKVGFFGFRYSATAGAWLLLSTTAQV